MKIYWTKRSESRFLEIQNYIEHNFGEETKTSFKNRIITFLELLTKFPKIGTLEIPEKNIYGFQITSQTRLFYRLDDDKISLLTFFDSRQNPEGKPK